MTKRVLAAAALLTAAVAVADEARRYEGPFFGFSYPARAKVQPGSDAAADAAVLVADGNVTATVLAGGKRLSDSELETTGSAWHAARMKNRAAWGMKADGGPPRDSVRLGERRWMRWRDRVGSVLGAQEQSMTCGGVSGHLGCVVVSAPAAAREAADALAAQLLTSLTMQRGR